MFGKLRRYNVYRLKDSVYDSYSDQVRIVSPPPPKNRVPRTEVSTEEPTRKDDRKAEVKPIT
jgi:hypothetical protein